MRFWTLRRRSGPAGRALGWRKEKFEIRAGGGQTDGEHHLAAGGHNICQKSEWRRTLKQFHFTMGDYFYFYML
jgi:hypothetical protein